MDLEKLVFWSLRQPPLTLLITLLGTMSFTYQSRHYWATWIFWEKIQTVALDHVFTIFIQTMLTCYVHVDRGKKISPWRLYP